MRLSEPVVDNVDDFCVFSEKGADLLGADANFAVGLSLGSLSHVLGEHVLGPVNILAEVEVVDFLGVATVTVTASNQIEQLVTGRHYVEVFHDSEELLGSDVLTLGTVEVLEAGLEQDTVGHDMCVEGSHHLEHALFLLFAEDLFEFGVKSKFCNLRRSCERSG